MLALVTCHISPPSIWYAKKMNSWHLTSRLTARSFSESTASRVRSGRCPRQCATLLHGQMYLQEKTPVLQFGHTLEQNSSICPSISYLWMVDLVMRFFSCGASLWRSSTRIRPKKGPAPWILFLTPAPRPLQFTFFWLVKLNICGCTPFARTNVFSEKNACFAIWARWHKILEFVPSCPICGRLAWRCDFFPMGQPLKIIRKYSVKKRSSPLDFIFDTCASASSSHFFWLVKLNMCVCTLLQGQLYFQQKKHVFCNLGARWHKILEFGPSCPISRWLAWRCDFFPVGQPLKIIRKYSVKKGPAPWILFLTPAPLPLEVTFLVGEGEHMWLYPFCKVI